MSDRKDKQSAKRRAIADPPSEGRTLVSAKSGER